jgi:hypothetical protein
VARVVAAQGHLKEAEELYRQLLADRQRVLGEDHPVTIATREFLADITDGTSLIGQPGVAPMEALMNVRPSAKLTKRRHFIHNNRRDRNEEANDR